MKRQFIKQNKSLVREFSYDSPAVLMRKRFTAGAGCRAGLSVCGLGYGYYYINGKEASPDLFTAAVSDYNKTLWYNTYDVSALLKEGENVICAVLGNGYYNENFNTPWEHNKVPWRDMPKLALELNFGGKILRADESWKCKADGGTYFNQLRSGEYFDARKYEENWNALKYDDSAWDNAVIDENPPQGEFCECPCEPIRECAGYPAIAVLKNGGKYVFDIGQNISGYAQVKVNLPAGTELTLRYAEELDCDRGLRMNGIDTFQLAVNQPPFQTDKIICGGKPLVWKPKFTYHGFRYVEIEGLPNLPPLETVTGVFVHNDVKRTGSFKCSDDLLNKIYQCGVMASLSNMHYVLTDCPTREKLGWMNDAAASCGQLCFNFGLENFLTKWSADMRDAMKPDGSMPGIVPSPGWGFNCGPVCDNMLFEAPVRLYQYYGNKNALKECLPYMERYLKEFDAGLKENRLKFWLSDWTGAGNFMNEDVDFINRSFLIRFYGIVSQAYEILGGDGKFYDKRFAELKESFAKDFIAEGGRCKIEEQTAIAILICNGLGDAKILGSQLVENIDRKHAGHQHTGMVGIQYLYDALCKTGSAGYVHRILTASAPSVGAWIKQGATTLWETWDDGGQTHSHNHHMYSACLEWFHKYVLGIKTHAGAVVKIEPEFVAGLDYAEGHFDSKSGRIAVSWMREERGIALNITNGCASPVLFRDKPLKKGENKLFI